MSQDLQADASGDGEVALPLSVSPTPGTGAEHRRFREQDLAACQEKGFFPQASNSEGQRSECLQGAPQVASDVPSLHAWHDEGPGKEDRSSEVAGPLFVGRQRRKEWMSVTSVWPHNQITCD